MQYNNAGITSVKTVEIRRGLYEFCIWFYNSRFKNT